MRMRRLLYPATAVGLLIAVAVGTFIMVRELRGEDTNRVAAAQPAPLGQSQPASPTPSSVASANLPTNPDTTKPGWHMPYLEASRGKPAFDQTVNGITVGPSAEHRFSVTCEPGTAHQVPIDQVDQAAAGPLMITAKYQPAGTVRFEAVATVCQTAGNQKAVVAMDVGFTIPSDPKTGRRGGIVMVSRWLGAPSATVSIPAERWASGTVAGRQAAVARPILANGLGQSAVVVHASGVVTSVRAGWLTFDEVQRIAEGLF